MNPLLVFAMKEESQDVFDDYDVLHTGIGKVNAAFGLMQRLRAGRPSLVINMGTAGSRRHAGGTLVNPTRFIQRDMDVTALGFEKFKTPFSDDPLTLEHGNRIEGLQDGLCGTGDSFDASEAASAFDVVDMEAYALALICKREAIPFLCLKYVSDGADSEACGDWHEALHHTASKLRDALRGAGL
ncbi:MAG: nucleosidase [Alphaproteobacteria bacterium]|nr:nucleosidase [Alphaproteobacteria bacterium]